jgi:tight junction protein 1
LWKYCLCTCLCAWYSLSSSIVAVASGLFVCRPGDYKPLPPPKAGASYKPVPPPKPKNYRPPVAPEGGGGGGSWSYGSGLPSQPCGDTDSTVASVLKQQTTGLPTYQHAKSYSVAGGLDSAGYVPQHNGGK